MSSKQKTWFKSVFDSAVAAESKASTASAVPDDRTPSVVRKKSIRKRAASSAIFDATSLEKTIDLTAADDDALQEAKLPQVPLRHCDITAANWLQNFAPHSIADLAIHPKKVEELQQWLLDARSRRGTVPMLCINGPAGCGKTATLRLLASVAGFEVQEWVQPVDVELSAPSRRLDDTDDGNRPAFAESQQLLFGQFLHRASRYNALQFGGPAKPEAAAGRLVLVEDFPNVFVNDSNCFAEVLEHYNAYGKAPLVFIVTDSRSRKLDLAYNLFPEAIRTKYAIASITFNAVSVTLLKRGLRRIAEIMGQPAFRSHYKPVQADTIDGIVLSAQGDLRNAMINMHMAAQKNSGALPMQIETKVGGARAKPKGAKLQSLGCDETITMMHALGRILNPKYSETDSTRLLHSAEQLADDFISQPSNMLNLIHANYAPHFRQIDDALRAADSLSFGDRLLAEWRDDVFAQFALNVAVRGVMATNRQPASGWHAIRGHRKVPANGGAQSLESELRRQFRIERTVSVKVMAVDYRTYARIIGAAKGGAQKPSVVEAGGQNCDDEDGEDASNVDRERKLMEQSIVW